MYIEDLEGHEDENNQGQRAPIMLKFVLHPRPLPKMLTKSAYSIQSWFQCVISGFRCEVEEICALLGYYAP